MTKRLIILTSFLITLVCVSVFAHPGYAESIWEKRKKAQDALQTIEKTAEETKPPLTKTPFIEEALKTTSIDPETIFIPDQFGSIIETHKGTNGKLIVHIQDAHANYEGQKNSASILESLIENYNLNLILREGTETDANFTYTREWGSVDTRKQAAEKLLKDAVISGIDYLDITSDYKLSFQGIEDRKLYEENKNMLWEIDKFKELAGEYVDKMIVVSDALKPNIYNTDLQELDKKQRDYENETIDLVTYYEYLYKTAEAKNLPLYTFPNFQNLIKATDLEKKIDLAKVRSGDATDEEMKLYNEYLGASASLNVNELFKEEPKLEDFVQDILTTSSDQRTLLKLSKALSIIKNLLRIKVVPEEYDYFVKNRKDFDPTMWTNFIKEKSQKFNVTVELPNNFYIISDNLPKIEKFYSIAEKRNIAFVTNTENRLNKGTTEIAALVAGGFHTPILTQLLGEKGFSYVVISPKVTTETDESLYRAQLKR